MFSKVAPAYFKKKLNVIPLKPKHKFPQDPQWDITDFENNFEAYPDHGIGLRLDQEIFVLDIDYTDEEKKKAVNKILEKYPTPVMRQGNPLKLPSRFYSKTWQTRKFLSDDKKIEILTDGQQCVIPPTHIVDKSKDLDYEAKWVGLSLLDINTDDLPTFPKEAWLELKSLFKKDTNKNETTGRNNKLVEIATAMIFSGESIEKAVDDLVEYDKLNHSPPLFEDKTENTAYTDDSKTNALLFYTNVMRSNSKINKIPSPFYQVDIVEPAKLKEIKMKDIRIKLPHLNGIGQKIFEYQYENAPVPRSRFCFASTIAFISTIIGNRLKLNSIHPNQYIMLIAPSSAGKDYPLTFTKNVLNDAGLDNLVGQGNPASESGVMTDLTQNPTRIDTIDEMSKILGVGTDYIRSPHATQVLDFYTEIYTNVGRPYKGKVLKRETIGKCDSPYVNIIGALTPEAFSKTFSESNIAKGLGGRFLFFPDTKKKRIPFSIEKGFSETPKWLSDYAHQWRNFRYKDNMVNQKAIAMDYYSTLNIDIPDIIEEIINFGQSIEVSFDTEPLTNRMDVMLIKIAIIDAVSNHTKFHKIPKINKSSILWAKSFLENYIKMVYKYLDVALKVDVLQKNQLNDFIIKKLETKPDGVTHTELTKILVKKGFFMQDIKLSIKSLSDAFIVDNFKYENDVVMVLKNP